MATKNRTVDMRGLTLQVAGIEAAPSATNNSNVSAGATKTLTAADAGKTILLDTLAGSVVTLPAATGTQQEFEFITSVIATSNSHVVKVANATDVMSGSLVVTNIADGTTTGFGTLAASDTITLNRGTTGSAKIGERFWLKDVKEGFWAVHGNTLGTGAEATPFSAGV
jgi:hypothetical protein